MRTVNWVSATSSLTAVVLMAVLSACTTLEPIADPELAAALQVGDSIVVKLHDGTKHHLKVVALDGEGFIGKRMRNKDRPDLRIAYTDVVHARRREFSLLRTSLLVVAVAVGAECFASFDPGGPSGGMC